MKNIFWNSIRVLGLLIAMVLGSIPFLVSFVCGIIFQRWLTAYSVAFVVTIGVTLLSAYNPEIFRVGHLDLRLHNGFFIIGFPELPLNVLKNLVLSYLGVMAGLSLRVGYIEGRRINPQG